MQDKDAEIAELKRHVQKLQQRVSALEDLVDAERLKADAEFERARRLQAVVDSFPAEPAQPRRNLSTSHFAQMEGLMSKVEGDSPPTSQTSFWEQRKKSKTEKTKHQKAKNSSLGPSPSPTFDECSF